MKNIVFKISHDFDMEKNYKLFRIFQDLINPVIGKKNFTDIIFNLDNKDLKVRMIRPGNNKIERVIIYIHGGGWVAGSLNSYTNTCLELATKTNSLVMLPEYSLAPEKPFPLGFNDNYLFTKFIFKNIDKLGFKEKDIVLMGDSAGGNLVASITQKGIDTLDLRVRKQILLYPTLQSDYSNNTIYKSVIYNGKNDIITQKQLQDFVKCYIKDNKDLYNCYAFPLLSKHLFGLPKTLLIVGSKDPLLDEGICYAKKLKRHLVSCKYFVFDNVGHGFFSNHLDKKYTNMAYDRIKEFLE